MLLIKRVRDNAHHPADKRLMRQFDPRFRILLPLRLHPGFVVDPAWNSPSMAVRAR